MEKRTDNRPEIPEHAVRMGEYFDIFKGDVSCEIPKFYPSFEIYFNGGRDEKITPVGQPILEVCRIMKKGKKPVKIGSGYCINVCKHCKSSGSEYYKNHGGKGRMFHIGWIKCEKLAEARSADIKISKGD